MKTCYFSFHAWLISLIVSPRVFRVATNDRLLFFLWLNNIPLCIYIVYLSIGIYLGQFHILAIMNSAAINTEVQMYLWHTDFIFFGYIPSSEIAGSYGSSISSLLLSFTFLLVWCLFLGVLFLFSDYSFLVASHSCFMDEYLLCA